MNAIRIRALLITALLVGAGSLFIAPRDAEAGELFNLRSSYFDRFFDYRQRSLYINHRPAARLSTAAAREYNPLRRSQGSGINIFEERRLAYAREAYAWQMDQYQQYQRMLEKVFREQQREQSRMRAMEVREARVRAVENRKAALSGKSSRTRLSDDLFGTSNRGSSMAPRKSIDANKPGFWNKLKSAFFG